jgi:hypothetical protein
MRDGDDYWAEQYRRIRPDYIVGVKHDPNTAKKKERIQKMGLKTKIILRPRVGDDRKEDHDDKGFMDASISQSGLRTFNFDFATSLGSRMFIFEQTHEGTFSRQANWRQLLDDKGFLK